MCRPTYVSTLTTLHEVRHQPIFFTHGLIAINFYFIFKEKKDLKNIYERYSLTNCRVAIEFETATQSKRSKLKKKKKKKRNYHFHY